MAPTFHFSLPPRLPTLNSFFRCAFFLQGAVKLYCTLSFFFFLFSSLSPTFLPPSHFTISIQNPQLCNLLRKVSNLHRSIQFRPNGFKRRAIVMQKTWGLHRNIVNVK